MATTSGWAGRIPRPQVAISKRFVFMVAGIAVILLVAVVYGYIWRSEKKQQRQMQNHIEMVAGDSAKPTPLPSNVSSTVPPLPPSAPAVQIVPAPPIAPPIAPPPPQTATPVTTTPYMPPRTPVVDHYQERLRAAIEAPLGASEKQMQVGNLQAAGEDNTRDLARALGATTPPYSGVMPVSAGTHESEAEVDNNGYNLQNGQHDKLKFLKGGEQQDDYQKATRVMPLSPWVLQRGETIPAETAKKAVTDLPGGLTATVVRDVYDSPTHRYVLIPHGSRLVGEYNSNISYAQKRFQAVWIAIYYPDGTHVDLERMPTESADGSAGLKDKVDNHWARIISGVFLSSVLAAGLQISQNRTQTALQYPSTGQAAAGAIGAQVSQLGEQLTNRNLQIQPSIEIRPGKPFAVDVNKDIYFDGPYVDTRSGN